MKGTFWILLCSSALLGTGVGARLLWGDPWLEWVNLLAGVLLGALSGVSITGWEWWDHHQKQKHILRLASRDVRDELRFLGYFEIDSPWKPSRRSESHV